MANAFDRNHGTLVQWATLATVDHDCCDTAVLAKPTSAVGAYDQIDNAPERETQRGITITSHQSMNQKNRHYAR